MDEDKNSARLGPAGWIALAVLLAFLAVSVWYAVGVWTAMSGVHMSGFGWLFLVLGVGASLYWPDHAILCWNGHVLLLPSGVPAR